MEDIARDNNEEEEASNMTDGIDDSTVPEYIRYSYVFKHMLESFPEDMDPANRELVKNWAIQKCAAYLDEDLSLILWSI